MKKLSNGIVFFVFLVIAIFNATGTTGWAQENKQSPLPAPTGPYSVGRTEFDWVDTARSDSQSPSGHREIVVWVWYPGVSPKPISEPVEWMPGKWGELFWPEYLAKKFPKSALPEIAERIKEHPINTILTHAYANASIAAGKEKYPVLLFEPGNGDLTFIYTTLIERFLASHGYVVAGIVPTYYTHFTVFSDGREVVAQKDHDLPPLPVGTDKRTSDDQEEFKIPGSGHTIYTSHQQVQAFEVAQKATEVSETRLWAGDMVFTLNQLQKLDTDVRSTFRRRLDFKRVGAFGHSRGGAVSLQVAKDEPRVLAALNLDGGVGDVITEGGVFKPLMIFTHEVASGTQTTRDTKDHFKGVLRDGKPSYHIGLIGSEHHFSSDFGLMPFFPRSVIAEMGSIDPTRALTITKAYVEAFFNQYLEGKNSLLLNSPSPEYPEITFQTNKQMP